MTTGTRESSNNQHQHQHRHHYDNNSTIAKDAKLLETVDATTTLELHRSNLIRLQTTELLQECQLKDLSHKKWAIDAHEYLQSISSLIQKLPSINEQRHCILADKPINVKLVNPKTSTKNKESDASVDVDMLPMEPIGCTKIPFAWTKPSGNAQCLPTFTLMVKIPNSVFSSKDYLNYRYFDKRNLVLDKVAKHLTKYSNQLGQIQYRWSNGMREVPHLELIPPVVNKNKKDNKKNKKKSISLQQPKFKVHLHIGLQNIDWIPKLLRLVAPNRCNIPHNHDNNNNDTDDDNNVESGNTVKQQEQQIESQLYNHSILYDARHIFEDQHLSCLMEDGGDEYSPNIEQTCVLIQIWALQRGLWRNHDGWTMENIALLLLYLLRTHKINRRMTPIQLLNVVFQTLTTTNWLGNNDINNNSQEQSMIIRAAHSQGGGESSQETNKNKNKKKKNYGRTVLVLPSEGYNEKQTIKQSQLAQLYHQQTMESPLTDNDPPTLLDAYSLLDSYSLGPVFLDPTMTYNYLGHVSPNYMTLLQKHAKASLQKLQPQQQLSSNNLSLMNNCFEQLFMTPTRFWNHQWDLYVQIPSNTSSSSSSSSNVSSIGNNSSSSSNDWEFTTRRLVHLLTRALGNRINGLRVLSTGNGELVKNDIDNNNNKNNDDADQIPYLTVANMKKKTNNNTTITRLRRPFESPTGTNTIILGISINSETSQRVVDRGPPSDHTDEVQSFIELWGKQKAQLRRFKDGAIVHAVIWNDPTPEIGKEYRFQNEDKLQGGIVERIIRHIIRVHHCTNQQIKFSLPSMLSIVDGVARQNNNDTSAMTPYLNDPFVSHRDIMKTFDALSDFLRKNSQPPLPASGSNNVSRLGLPLAIDAVEPLSPSLRYAELFPPVPHPFLGGGSASSGGSKKVSGAIVSDPILIQIRFGSTSKWPTDLKAIGAAKAAMLVQLANGIEEMGATNFGFEGPITVAPSYIELGYRGYCFRVLIRADPELRMLNGLQKPGPEAIGLLKDLTRKHVMAAMHHSTIHAVHTLHPSAGAVVRMARRWVSGHLLSSIIPLEAIELIVAKAYTPAETPLGIAPATVAAGFLSFLHIVATHDWAGEPLIVNPRGHIDDTDRRDIILQFEKDRGFDGDTGPPMYIIAPYNRQDVGGDDDSPSDKSKSSTSSKEFIWTTSIQSPEWVVLTRTVALAKRSYNFLRNQSNTFDDSDWSAVFHETTASFKSYSGLLRIDSDFVFDPDSSSTGGRLGVSSNKKENNAFESVYTRSMRTRFIGPTALRRTLYRNLRESESDGVLLNWKPIDSMVDSLRERFGHLALFFYNDLSPEVIALLWRPEIFSPMPFSVLTSEHVKPVDESEMKLDSLVNRNSSDIVREISQFYQNIVTTVKIFDHDIMEPSRKRRKMDADNDESS